MATQFTHRLIIIVPVLRLLDMQLGARVWDIFAPNSGAADKTFGDVLLSATGTAPATHTACNTACTDGMRTEILSRVAAIPVISRPTVYDVKARGWNDQNAWANALADAGLKVIPSN